MSKNDQPEKSDKQDEEQAAPVHRGTEGGGPWPPELLERHLTPLPCVPPKR